MTITSSASALRASGLVSGLDVDSLVQKLMAAEKSPLNKLLQKKQIIQWQQDDYRALNSKVLALKNQAFTMKLSTAYRQYTATSSNDSIVSVSATSGASPTAYTIDSITNLAKSSNISTADGQTVSRSTSVAAGGTVTTPINTTNNNTFKINYNGGGFVDVTLAPGKTYDGVTPGGQLTDLVSDLQTVVDTALSGQGVAAGTVKVSLNKNNNIEFTSNNYPVNTAPGIIVLQEGAANDLLKTGMGFATDATSHQITSSIQKIDVNDSIYNNLVQNRFGNIDTGTLNWIVNGSYSQTLGANADNITSTVAYNSTNTSNYKVVANENQAIAVAANSDNFSTTLNYNAVNYSNVTVSVNGTNYTVVGNVAQSNLQANQVAVSDDGTGKMKLTFKNTITAGANIQVNQKTTYSVVTGVAQASLTANQVLLSDDGSGNAKFTFKSQLATGTKVTADRHDFQFATASTNQDGTASNETFVINAMTETMNSLTTKITADSTAGLSSFYDSSSDKMIFTAKNTGKNNASGSDITLTGNFLTAGLQMTKYTNGADASLSINGLATTRKSNSFSINGVNFTLKGTSVNPINVGVNVDTDKIFTSIKTFVDAYNDTISAVNAKYSEKRDRDYQPLTDDQKSQMKDSDIKSWEDKSKAGLLHGDILLSSVTGNMRRAFYDKVQNVADPNYNQLTDIGITTSSIYQDQGKLVIDEAKLRDTISQAPDKVAALFTSFSTAADKTQNYNETGLAGRIYNFANDAINSFTDKAGVDGSYVYSMLDQDMSQTDTQILDLQNRLSDKETQYYNQFTQLETAMQKANSQSAWLSQQLGSK